MSKDYIVLNKSCGTYSFRYIIPERSQHLFPSNKKEFRRTLNTKCRVVARRRAMVYWAKLMDDIELAEADDENWKREMLRGKELLKQLDVISAIEDEYCNFYERDEFFARISDYDKKCIITTSDYEAQKSSENPAHIPSESNNKVRHPITEIINRYIKEKEFSTKNRKTLDSYRATITLFLNIIKADTQSPDVEYIDNINSESVIFYKHNIGKLPPNMNKKKEYRGKTVQQLLKMNIEDTISDTTIKTAFTRVSTFLHYLHSNKFIGEDYSDMLKGVIKPSKRNDSHRAAFTLNDLNKMFGCEEYQTTGFQGYTFRYWIPLLALYTGARENEICQLQITDVYESDGILVIDINDKGDKKLKNSASRRIVPIHKQLISLGFEKYLKSIGDNGLLFPTLTSNSYGDYTRKLGNFFNSKYKSNMNGFLGYVGIEKYTEQGSKVFHSFRHTFINQAKQQQLNPQIVKSLVGHSKDDITFDTYGKSFDLKTLKKELDKIVFGCDLPKKWEKRFL